MARRKKSMRLGGGGRFAKGVEAIEKRGIGEERAKGIMAAAGRKKYGKARFQAMASAGKRRRK